MEKDKIKNFISLCKRRGFIFQSSEIYGGVEALWDFGPLGTLLENNIKNEWIKNFVQKRENIFLIDGSVIMHPMVWRASGHIENFTDPLIECKECHSRYRADHMADGRFVGEGKAKEKNQCPNCGAKNWTDPKNFNLMFKTFIGPVEDEAHITYLRPETAQSMFTNFKNLQESMRQKIPFGIAQIGRCFRNEITTGNFIFRAREFDIAEIEYFVKPGEDEKEFNSWVKDWQDFYLEIGIKKENLRLYEHPKESLAHYSKRTIDIEYNFSFGWSEIAGIANRTDFDLKQHSKFSSQDLRYFDPESKEKYFPYVIEPTMGIGRVIFAVLYDAYEEIEGGRTKTTEAKKEKEVLLRINKKIAPIKVAVLPLVKNKKEIVKKSREIFEMLIQDFVCQYDEVGTIGRRYRRQDEIGTPYCVTVDFETLKDDTVTLRDRDTMEQERFKTKELNKIIKERLEN